MSGLVTRSSYAGLLEPGINMVWSATNTYPTQWTEIYSKHMAEKAVETDIEIKGLGYASQINEGASVNYDSWGQFVTTNYIMKKYANAYIITEEAIRDNLYKSQIENGVTMLKNSLSQCKEVQAAAIFNNGFNSGAFATGDGQALFSTGHLTGIGTTYANTPSTQADLNETSLEAALVAIQRFIDAAGLRTFYQPKKLLVPAGLQFQASRLLNSTYRTATADNDINAVQYNNYLPEGFVVNQFLTDDSAWFVLTNAANGFKYFERDKLETKVQDDFGTGNVLHKAKERYAFGVSDPRAAYGSSGVA